MEFINKDLYSDKTGVYQIMQLSTGFAYIGQTSEKFIRRYWHNDWCLINGKHQSRFLQEAFSSTGDSDFVFSVLDVVDDINLLDSYEIKRIAEARDRGKCFNISAGGKGKKSPMSENAKRLVGEANRKHMTGKKMSDSTREKMGKSSRHTPLADSHKKILSEYMKNRTVSEQTRIKISSANCGSKSKFASITDEIAYSIKSDLISGFSIKETANMNGVSYGIVSCIANDRTWNNIKIDGWDSFVLSRKQK